MTDDTTEQNDRGVSLEARAEEGELLQAGLKRFRSAVSDNRRLVKMDTSLGRVVTFFNNLLEPYASYERHSSNLITFNRNIQKHNPLFLLPDTLLLSIKEWILFHEVKALSYTPIEAIDAVVALGNLGVYVSTTLAERYDDEDPTGRDLRYEIEQLRMRCEGLVDTADDIKRRAAEEDQSKAAVKRAEAAALQAEERASHVAEVAGATANSELATHYNSHADAELGRYRWWTGGLFGSVIVALVLGWSILHGKGFSTSSWTKEEVSRLLLLLPVLALAAYASRQALYHRDAEARSRLTAVQLKTVRAFTDFLTPTAKADVLSALGKQIFSLGAPDSATENGYGLPSEVTALLKDALAQQKKEIPKEARPKDAA